MYTESTRAYSSSTTKRPSPLSQLRLLGKRKLGFLGSIVFIPLLLMGCAERVVSNGEAQQQQEVLPEIKVVDYRSASCDTLFQIDEKEALENSLYWLQVMDCADRLGTTQARALAETLPDDHWQGVFKQSILLGSAEPTPTERRQLIDRLNLYHLAFPHRVRPLLQLWRQQHIGQIALFDQRTRYQQLQERSDNQIDTLRQSQHDLQSKLNDTMRKLENLTDIERQLSSRKQLQGELPESGGPQVKMGTSTTPVPPATKAQSVPNGVTETGTALPVEDEDNDLPPPIHKEQSAP